MTTITKQIGLFYNGGDSAAVLLKSFRKNKQSVKCLTMPTRLEQLPQFLERLLYTTPLEQLVLPTTWEHYLDPMSSQCHQVVHDVANRFGVPISIPHADTMLETLVKRTTTREVYAGTCAHINPDYPKEQCGMCMDCLEKYLILKKLGRDTEDLFLEDPIDGLDGKRRLYALVHKMGRNGPTTSRIEVVCATLMADAFIADHLPLDVCHTIEKHHREFVKAWA